MHTSALMIMPGCAIASGAAPAPPPLAPPAPGAGADAARTRAIVARFVDLLYTQRRVRAAFESCVAASGFIDHGEQGVTLEGGGRGEVMARLAQRYAAPGLQLELRHLVVDGDTAVAHVAVRLGDGPAAARVDIFRIAGDRIVEHWGVGG